MSRRHWTTKEEGVLRRAYDLGRPISDCASDLSRSRSAVYQMAFKLKLTRRRDQADDG